MPPPRFGRLPRLEAMQISLEGQAPRPSRVWRRGLRRPQVGITLTGFLGLSGRLGRDVARTREDSPEPCSGLRGNLLVGHPVIDEIDDGHLRVARRITREPNTIWRVCQRSSRLGSHHFVMMGGMSNSAPGIGDDSARCDACGGPVVEIVFGMPTSSSWRCNEARSSSAAARCRSLATRPSPAPAAKRPRIAETTADQHTVD
jgi:hypothetical protein